MSATSIRQTPEKGCLGISNIYYRRATNDGNVQLSRYEYRAGRGNPDSYGASPSATLKALFRVSPFSMAAGAGTLRSGRTHSPVFHPASVRHPITMESDRGGYSPSYGVSAMSQDPQGTTPKIRVIRLASAVKRLRRHLERTNQSLIVSGPRSQRYAELGQYAIKTDNGEIIARVSLEARLRSYGLMTDDERLEQPHRWIYRLATERENGAIEFLPGEYPSMVSAAAAAGDADGLQIIVTREAGGKS